MNTQFIMNKIGHWNFRKLTTYIVLLAVTIGLVSSWFWYFNMYMTTERRFWSAINTSMATPSAVRTLQEGESGNFVEQKYRFFYSPEKVFQNKVSYTERDATTNTFVETEGIVYYPQDQFLRYTAFNSRQDTEDAVDIDELIGVWASKDSQESEQDSQTFQSELVTLAIFGNFDARFRNEILRDLKSTNTYGDVSVALEDVDDDGNDILTYGLTVKLKPYITALNKAFERAGYDDFPPLDPSNYEDDSTVPATFTVRKRGNMITKISFGGRSEAYSNYGVSIAPERPEASLTVEELQQQVREAVQALQ
jgi:hypothetical protein